MSGASLDWATVRSLFDAVCDLPADRWQPALQELTDDPAMVAESLSLLRAQTVALGGVQQSLDAFFTRMDEPAAQVGQRLGPWRLQRLLGTGGMGMVYLAERADRLYRRTVAIKLIRRRWDAAMARQLSAESQFLADLQHPGIARLLDAGVTEDGQPYLVMEYVDGRPLDAACRDASLDRNRVLRLFAKVCRAVQAAHAQGVIHCDLKPGNVLVRADGEPVLLDFGIARLLDDGGDVNEFATPAYASPERMAGRPAGVASDIYSLGVMLSELLAALSAGAPANRDLLAIAGKAQAGLPLQRYVAAEALAEDIERFLDHRPVRAGSTGRSRRLGLFLRRNWRGSVLASIALLAAGVFVMRLSDARAAAEQNAREAAGIADVLVAAFDAADPALRGDVQLSARDVLDQAAGRIEHDLEYSPAIRARLQATLGRAYQNLGRPQQAETLLRAGMQGLAEAGAPPRQQAAARVALALQLSDARNVAEARELAGQALQLLDRDDDRPTRVQALNALGRAQSGSGADGDARAEASLLQALALVRQESGTEARRGEATTLANLGALYRTSNQLDRSEATLRDALRAAAPTESMQGLEYQRVLRSLSFTLLAQGRTDEALQLGEEGFELTRRLFGAESSYTAAAEAELAGQYLDLGRYHRAETHFLDSLATSARVDGEDSQAFASKVLGLGIMEEARGDYLQAERRYRQALALRRRALGPTDASSLDTEMILARLLLRSDRTAEAEEPLRRIAAHWRRELAASSRQLLTLRLVEIEWMTRAGRLAEAGAALREFARRNPDPGTSLKLRQQMQLALLAQRAHDPVAVERWAETVATFEQLYGADSTATAKWRIALAEVLLEHGQAPAARAQIDRARPWLGELSPDSDFLRRIAVLDTAMAPSTKIAQAR
ncbi:serine/threonine-protein kinase [Stenotrophomonas tumulicola]|uniref:Tetratricopeptide repeat protein n=1 Tax=Stenotrophomonas tumulicola TaxID=1685415 RepID=A0A7W3FJA7_9GAMM|nr:serine/threonine-protein kinase [Stenotrophomonas tumulicola]MBA8680281.1 tetratricopeptide repeat protein [Stenotrophomonas tumulicola]